MNGPYPLVIACIAQAALTLRTREERRGREDGREEGERRGREGGEERERGWERGGESVPLHTATTQQHTAPHSTTQYHTQGVSPPLPSPHLVDRVVGLEGEHDLRIPEKSSER